jgi:hypothetical protein
VPNTPNLHSAYVESLRPIASQIAKSISGVFPVIARTFVDVLVDPQFEVFFVGIATEAESFAFVEPLIRDVVQPEVLVVPITHVGRVEVDLRVEGENEA